MKVVEIFDSIQGEGCWMGTMCTFIRLPGCNLECPFCDERSKYDTAEEMTLVEIMQKVHHRHVVITGGEPTLHDLRDLIYNLHTYRHFVHIETNGTNPVFTGGENNPDWITCSPKGPRYHIACAPNEIKLVIDESITPEQALSIYNPHQVPVWLQPCDGPFIGGSRQKILDWLKKHPNEFRAGIQLHKWYEVI